MRTESGERHHRSLRGLCPGQGEPRRPAPSVPCRKLAVRKRLVAAAVPLSLLSATGCAAPARLNGVRVDDDLPFLAVVEQAWRRAAAAEPWVVGANHPMLAAERQKDRQP